MTKHYHPVDPLEAYIHEVTRHQPDPRPARLLAVALTIGIVAICAATTWRHAQGADLAYGRVLQPYPDVGYDIVWRADLYGRGVPPLRDVPIAAVTAAEPEPHFQTRKACRRHGEKTKVAMLRYVTDQHARDGTIRYRCVPGGSQ